MPKISIFRVLVQFMFLLRGSITDEAILGGIKYIATSCDLINGN